MATLLTRAHHRDMPANEPKKKTFIREWRKYRGLTLQRLADRLDMTPSHLSMLERGERGYTQETLEAIADALSTQPGSLLMRNPTNESAIWSIWDNALPADRARIEAVVMALVGERRA